MDTFSYGTADVFRGVPISNKTRYRVASVSKHVATIGLMQLYERGLFHLDDDVSGALGFKLRNPYFPDDVITYRMVLSHQSSIG
jgi:CubicO group peptidase (beta-lactamase class C family)